MKIKREKDTKMLEYSSNNNSKTHIPNIFLYNIYQT